MVITRASLRPFPWTNHLTYGLDYALVSFLLAVFIFQRRSLSRDEQRVPEWQMNRTNLACGRQPA